jgi:hypothetical protein
MATFTQKLKNLFIPQKVMNSTDARAIENWVSGDLASFLNALVAFINAGGGTTFYASLTGPGQTSPSGKLTQNGDFQINGNTLVQANFTGPGTGGSNAVFDWEVDEGAITLSTATGGAMFGSMLLRASGIQIESVNASTGLSVTANGHAIFDGRTNPAGTTAEIAFFGVSPQSRQSGTGVTTVAQLVTILQNYGLLS